MPSRVIGRKELTKRLLALPKEIHRQVPPDLEKSATELVEMQKRLVPVRAGPRSGELRDSIRWEPGETDLQITVKAGYRRTAVYAAIVEFGSVYQAAQAYFFPAYRALRVRIRRRIARAVGKAVRTRPPGTTPPIS